MKRRSTTASLALLASLAAGSSLAFSACGAGASSSLASESPKAIVNSAANAISKASSVHLDASGSSNGQKLGINMELFKSGDIDGTLSIAGHSFQIVIANGGAYLKADLSFWESSASVPPALAKKLANKWVKAPSASNLGVNSFSMKSLATSLRHPGGGLSKGGIKTIDGESAISIKAKGHGTLWVASSGTPYPVEIDSFGSAPGKASLTRWNLGTLPTVPKGALNLAGLAG
ncbi:MAG: hypothetical protein ACRDZP_08080 [Acidimicrobiales bacterium]